MPDRTYKSILDIIQNNTKTLFHIKYNNLETGISRIVETFDIEHNLETYEAKHFNTYSSINSDFKIDFFA